MAAELVRQSFNQSRIKTFLWCPKQYEYKFVQNLERKRRSRPLFLGSWVHRALETHYVNGDWKLGHKEYADQWDKLFEEERIQLQTKRGRVGPPLPEIVERIMRSYAWYYRDDNWKPVMVEQILEVETPLKYNGKFFVFKGRLDLVVEDFEGRNWLVDHKTATTIPDVTAFHAMDRQLMLYPWAAKIQYGIELAGIIFNYVKSRPPTMPQLTQGGAISRRKISTDYPTLFRFLKSNGYDPNDFRDILIPLRNESPYLKRYRLPREKHVTKEVLLDTFSTLKKIEDTNRFVRNVTRMCERTCEFHNLCLSELNGFDTTFMRKADFQPREDDYVSGDLDPAGEDEEDEFE